MEEKIKDFCKKWGISEFSIFGSYIRNELREDSDVDVLISFKDNVKYTLFDMVHIQKELENMFERKVDVITKKGLENSRNHIRKKAIFNEAKLIYAS